jgi:DNA-binding response OmpR family regulator
MSMRPLSKARLGPQDSFPTQWTEGGIARSAGHRKRLLLVEGEAGLLMTLAGRLAREGYEVECAIDRETGFEHASTRSFDGPQKHSFGLVHVDFRKAEVEREGLPVRLSAKELRLLQYFIAHAGAAISRDELLDGVWGHQAMLFTRTVDVHVASLRKKVEPEPQRPQYILTVHGIGYKFVG